jgi:hypothetical protein
MEELSKDVQSVHPSRRTSSESADRFRQQIRALLRRAPPAAVEALIDSLDASVDLFCRCERREAATRPLGEIKRELRPIARQIDKLLDSLQSLSEQARDEVDAEIWPGFEMPQNFLAAEQPFVWKNPDDPNAQGESEPLKRRPPASQSTYYIDPLVVTATRFRGAIQTTLDNKSNKGGAPRQLNRHFLAYQVAHAMQVHLGLEPSATSGPFQELLGACLRVGLAAIPSDASPPDDLRLYMLSALQHLRTSGSSIKPPQK